MAFYIKPPSGKTPLWQLQNDAETRLQFLLLICQCGADGSQLQQLLAGMPELAASSDCLIEGSQRDRTSHFMLRSMVVGNITSQAEEVLICGIRQLQNSPPENLDDQIQNLLQGLCITFFTARNKRTYSVRKTLLADDIVNHVQFFPMCMLQIHRSLISSRRVKHHSRIRYTLFLKEIGLPLDECLKFWERFYSQPKTSESVHCQHKWEGKDAARYAYSIRHLYGFEGQKKDYASHSCSTLQAMLPQPGECGGCPFVTLDSRELRKLLDFNSHLSEGIYDDILESVEEGNPTKACGLVLARTMYVFHCEVGSELKLENKERKFPYCTRSGQSACKNLDGIGKSDEILALTENALNKCIVDTPSFSHIHVESESGFSPPCKKAHVPFKVNKEKLYQSNLGFRFALSVNALAAVVRKCKCEHCRTYGFSCGKISNSECINNRNYKLIPELPFVNPAQYYLAACQLQDKVK